MLGSQEADDALFKSLLQKDTYADALKLRTCSDSGRGLTALRSISAGETLLRIPFRHLINLKTIAKITGYDWKRPPCPAHAAIAVHLLYEKSLTEQSPLASYLCSLPTMEDFQGIPLCWSEESRSKLPLSAQAKLLQQQTLFDKHYEQARNLAAETSLYKCLDLQFDKFLWAWLLVNSRSIYQQLSTVSTIDDNYACAALVDMLNHVPSQEIHAKLLYDKIGLTVEAQTSYEAGQEVFISYGAHGNEALVLEYGFYLPDNTDNSLSLDDLMQKLFSEKHRDLLEGMGYLGDYTVDYQGRISFRVEVALRIGLLSEQEIEDGGEALRRVMQYSQGLNSGRDTNAAAHNRLRQMLDEVVSRASKMIESIASEPISRQNTIVVKNTVIALHQDQITIANLALAQLE